MASTSLLDHTFKLARDDFFGSLKNPAAAKAMSAATSIEDVAAAIRDIEAQQQNSKKLRALGRLKPFVKGLQEYAGVIEVFVQVKPDMLGLIWGPLKFLLQAASSVITLFEKMLDVFGEVGRILPQFQRYSELFQQNGPIRRVLSLFYKEILTLYTTLLNFLNHPGRNSFLEAIWPNVRGKITVIQENIQDHEKVMTSHVTLEHVLQAHKERERAIREDEKQEEARNRQYWKEMHDAVSPQLYDDRLQDILTQSSVDSGQWLDDESAFRTWLDAKSKSRYIWLCGMPGAGKTFLAANLVRRLQDAGRHVLFLFLSHDKEIPSHAHPLHSILFQALKDSETLRPLVYKTYRSRERKFCSDAEMVRGLLSDVLQAAPTYIIVDGLDELHEDRRGPLLRALLRVVDACDRTRLLISSRDERDLRRQLDKKAAQLRVDQHNAADIKKYVEIEGIKLVERLLSCGAEPGMCDQIRESSQAVAQKSEGMILYATLIFRMVDDLGTLEEMHAEFEDLPKGLKKAYGRIIDRIESQISPVLRSVARKVLQWVTCARRPLREEEMLQILVIEPGAADFTKGRRDNRDIRQACGPIIEIVDGYARFVHFSAKEYLLDKQSNHFLNLPVAHIEAASVCSSYLSYSSLDPIFDLHEDNLRERILDGSFVLLEYAAMQWIEHVKAIGTSGRAIGTTARVDPSQIEILADHIQLMRRRRTDGCFTDGIEGASGNPLLDQFRLFQSDSALQAFLDGSAQYLGRALHGLLDQSIGELPDNSPSDPATLLTELERFRNKLEDMLCKSGDHSPICHCKHLRRLYADNTYHCNRLFCPMFQQGFTTKYARDGHLRTHERPFKCPECDCIFAELGFRSEAERRQHLSKDHSDPSLSDDEGSSDLDGETLEIPPDDKYQILRDAVCSDQVDLVRSLFGVDVLSEGDFNKLMHFAAWKASPDMLGFLLSYRNGSSTNALRNLLATAIETENHPNIKFLLSHGATMTQSGSCGDILHYLPRNRLGERQGGSVLRINILRAIGLFSPDLMEFLVEECGVLLPAKQDHAGDIFRSPGFRNVDPAEITRRLNEMKKYVLWPEASTEGLYSAVIWGPPEAVKFCLENGADPNYMHGGDRHVLYEAACGEKIRMKGEIVKILLQHGSDPLHPKMKPSFRKLRGVRVVEEYFGLSWEEFVRRTQAGEDLEGGRNRKKK